jgi:hypothetical protein
VVVTALPGVIIYNGVGHLPFSEGSNLFSAKT